MNENQATESQSTLWMMLGNMTDNQFAVSLSIICLVLIALLWFRSSLGFVLNLVGFIIYSLFYYVKMHFHGDDDGGKAAFGIWGMLVTLTLIHIGLLLLCFLYALVTFVWRNYLRDHHLFNSNE